MLALLNGMTTMGFLVVAMFFVRFWQRTRDPLFATFAGAFLLLAFSQILIGLSVVPDEQQSLLYLLRFAAFALLIAAIVWKNIQKDPAGLQ
jgi:hypothetical protein